MDTDIYYHKLVLFRGWKQELKFRTSQELFSAHDIDTGSRFLLRTIAEAGYPPPSSVLDLGCGYGTLGLVLKSLYPECTVHLADRDALAVDYARQNAQLNNLSAECYASLGYDDVTRNDFNLIVSNIPGKAGEPVIICLLREARYHLKPGGMAAIVVVTPLEALTEKVLTETDGAEIVFKRARTGHTVFHYRFTIREPKPETSALERSVYQRKDITFKHDKLSYHMQTAYGLPEFDSLSYDTELLLEALTGLKNQEQTHPLVLNPGQGHVPVVIRQLFRPQSIALCGRDLLALRYSRLNLIDNGCPAGSIRVFHASGLEIESHEPHGLIAGVLPEENREALQQTFEQAAGRLSDKGILALAGSSTAITRLETYAGEKPELVIKGRERRRGYSVLVAAKTAPKASR